jgi:ribosomal protein S1
MNTGMPPSDSRGSPGSLDREIDEALEGVDLQAIDDVESAPSAALPPRQDRGKTKSKDLWPGTVVGTSGDDVFVELGPRMQGVIKLTAFDEPPRNGARFDFALKGQEEGLWLLSLTEAKTLAAWSEIEVGALVKARVSGQNTGGLELKVGPLSAFMPASHVAIGRVEDLSALIGQSLECEVLEIDRAKKRVLLSRRRALEAELESSRQQTLGAIVVGQIVQGKVTRTEPFGAFVDIGGGLEGLVHVSNLSLRRVENASEVLRKGQEVRVKVLEIKEGGKRIGLGMKQLEADPWQGAASRYPENAVVQGTVVRLTEFGAFLELEPGLDGLLHVSQMGPERVRRPKDVLAAGQELAVRVVSIDPGRQRISLSRLDPRGAVIGSDQAVDGGMIEDVIRSTEGAGAQTNLGDLFRKALG